MIITKSIISIKYCQVKTQNNINDIDKQIDVKER